MRGKIVLTAFAVLCGIGAAHAQTSCTTYPYTFVNGTTADATQIMGNFNCAALTGKGLFTGNVGIGTSNPISTIDINGYLHAAGNVVSPNFSSQGAYLDWNLLTSASGETDFVNNQGLGTGGFAFWNTPSSGAPQTTLMFLTGSGSLGIGTTGPGDTLDVTGGAVIGAPAPAERLSFFSASLGFNRKVETGAIYNPNAYAYQFQHFGSLTAASDALVVQVYNPTGTTAAGAALVINGLGNVGIWTSPSTQHFGVNGNVDVMANGGYLTEIPNATTTGTTADKLAKLTGAPATAVIAATTDTDGVIGVVVGAAGTTGSAQIAINGQASCVFENATTAGDFVSIGSSTAGDCHDAGASRPASGQTLGRVLATVTAGSSAEVLLYIR